MNASIAPAAPLNIRCNEGGVVISFRDTLRSSGVVIDLFEFDGRLGACAMAA